MRPAASVTEPAEPVMALPESAELTESESASAVSYTHLTLPTSDLV